MSQLDIEVIDRLIVENKLQEVQEHIAEIDDPRLKDFVQSLIYYKRGDHTKVLDLLDELIKEDETFELYHRIHDLRAKSLHFAGNYRESLEQIGQLSKKLDFLSHHHSLVAIEIGNYIFLGDFDQAVELGKEALLYAEIEQDKTEKMKILKNIGTAYFQLGNYEEAENYFALALEVNHQLNNTAELAILYNNIGLVNYARGNLDIALDNYDAAMVEFQKVKAESSMAVVYSNIALIYQSKNDFNKALEYMKKSLIMQEKLANNYYISICQTNLARIYMDKGNLNMADQLLLRSVAINEKLQNKYLLAESYTEYAQLLYRRGDHQEARNYLQKALVLREEIGDKNMITYTLYIAMKIDVNHDFDQAEAYYRQLQSIADDFDNKYVQIRFQLAKALILRHSPRLKHQSQAQMIYEELLEQDLPHYDFKIDVIQNLFDLLVHEIVVTKEMSLISNLEELSRYMSKFSEEQNSRSLEIQFNMLQSRIELIKNNTDHARTLLIQAMHIAEEYNLHTLYLQIASEFNYLIEDIRYLTRDGPDNVEQHLKPELFGSILDNPIDLGQLEVEEIPQVFFLIKNGQLVYNIRFSDVLEINIKDAILSRENDIFSQFQHHDLFFELYRIESYLVIVSFIHETMVGLVFEGQSYHAMQKLETILTLLRSSTELQEFLTGNSAHFTSPMREDVDNIVTSTFDVEQTAEIDPISRSQVVKPLPILKNYEVLLHPIRLIIIKLLTSHYSLLRSDLLKLTGLNSGTLQTHLDTLEKLGWISKEMEFVDNRPRSIIYIESSGTSNYQEFMTIFKEHILE